MYKILFYSATQLKNGIVKKAVFTFSVNRGSKFNYSVGLRTLRTFYHSYRVLKYGL